jgi:hypothetical protein
LHDCIVSLRGEVWVNKPYVLFCSCRMAEATTSRYESNYIKIAMVVLRVSSRAVRVQFDKEFQPNCLQRTLKSECGRLFEHRMKKRITKPQWNLLFPRTGRLLYLFCLSQFLAHLAQRSSLCIRRRHRLHL